MGRIEKSAGYCCYECGKQIKGQMQYIVPPIWVTLATGIRPRAYHPACYDRSEEKAAAELERAADHAL